MIMTVTYALMYGVFVALGSTLSNLFNPYGFSPSEIAIIGLSCQLPGIAAALLVGIWLDYTQLYRKSHIAISFVSVIAIILTAIVLSDEKPSL